MKLILLLSLLASAVFAESFGGIGVTIQSSDHGVQVVTVLPGAQAELAGMQPGDHIQSVNGVSLVGKSIEECTSLIRGESGSLLQLGIVKAHDGSLWARELTRVGLKVETLDQASLNETFSKTEGLTAAEIQYFANIKAEAGYQFLGALQDGKLLEEGSSVNANQVNTIYVGSAQAPKTVQPKLQDGRIALQGFDRSTLNLRLDRAGATQVQILDAQGKTLESWNLDAEAGSLRLAWNGTMHARGNVSILVRQGMAQSSFSRNLP